MALLEVRDLKTNFHTRDGIVRAVDEAIANGDLELLGVTRDAFPSFMARRAR